jgi:hypothetical protein
VSRELFRNQLWHGLSVVILVAIAQLFVIRSPGASRGSLWGVETTTWFWVAIAIPIIHQVYVWLVWRLELYANTFSSLLGVEKSFAIYSAGFSVLFVGRLIAIIVLALSNRESVSIPPYLAYPVAAAVTVASVYLFYSVRKYFTIARAFGIDHFDKGYDVPYVKGGIFRFTNNGMYVYGLTILYLPGLLLSSQSALMVALFNHLYIWVHYYCTERPDMRTIYGSAPGEAAS